MVLKDLKPLGWHIDEPRVRDVFGEDFNESLPSAELTKLLLDIDIREIGSPVLQEALAKGYLDGPAVLQLSKWDNVSYPKINDHTKNDGVCTLQLSDGSKTVKAMAVEPLPKISGDTVFGSKVLITGRVPFESGILQLSPSTTKLLGGNVQRLVEKWRSDRFATATSKANRQIVGNAPRWQPFQAVKKQQPATEESTNFKAMAVVAPPETAQPAGDNEFDEARRQEIAALSALKQSKAAEKAPPVLSVAPRSAADRPKPKEREPKPQKPRKEYQSKYTSSKYDDDYVAPRASGTTLFDAIQSAVGPGLDLTDLNPRFEALGVEEAPYRGSGGGSRGQSEFRNSGPRNSGSTRGQFDNRGRSARGGGRNEGPQHRGARSGDGGRQYAPQEYQNWPSLGGEQNQLPIMPVYGGQNEFPQESCHNPGSRGGRYPKPNQGFYEARGAPRRGGDGRGGGQGSSRGRGRGRGGGPPRDREDAVPTGPMVFYSQNRGSGPSKPNRENGDTERPKHRGRGGPHRSGRGRGGGNGRG